MSMTETKVILLPVVRFVQKRKGDDKYIDKEMHKQICVY